MRKLADETCSPMGSHCGQGFYTVAVVGGWFVASPKPRGRRALPLERGVSLPRSLRRRRGGRPERTWAHGTARPLATVHGSLVRGLEPAPAYHQKHHCNTAITDGGSDGWRRLQTLVTTPTAGVVHTRSFRTPVLVKCCKYNKESQVRESSSYRCRYASTTAEGPTT